MLSEKSLGVRLHDYGKLSIDEMFARIKKDGFHCCQLAYPKAIAQISSYEDVTPKIVEETKAAMKKFDIEISVLGIYLEFAIDCEEVRRNSIEAVKRMIPIAKELQVKAIGFETTDMRLQPSATSRERAVYLLCKSLEEILPRAEEAGVTIAVESVYWHSINTPQATKMLLDSMQSPNLGTIFDAGNLLPKERVKEQKLLWEEVEDLYADTIKAVHYKSQSYGKDGLPKACGQKENLIDWDLIFPILHKQEALLPIIREEIVPCLAGEDRKEMERLIRFAKATTV